MATDSRILKIMARVPVALFAAQHTPDCEHSKGYHDCTCGAKPVQMVTMDEVRKAMERFQQELVFNMPNPIDYVNDTGRLKATEKHLIGDSQLEIRYAD